MPKKQTKEKPVKLYICATEWNHEMGHLPVHRLYPTVNLLKKEMKCWKECGIIQVEVSFGKYKVIGK